MNKLYTSLFYTPGTSYTPHTSPLHSLSLSQPERIHLFSLASPAGGEGQKGEVLVYNLLVLKGMREREWFRGRVWSGAVLSFQHPSSQHPWTQEFSPSSPASSSPSLSSPEQDDGVNLSILFAQLKLCPGILPPEQDEGGGMTVYADEENPVVVGFRSKIEVRIARGFERQEG